MDSGEPIFFYALGCIKARIAEAAKSHCELTPASTLLFLAYVALCGTAWPAVTQGAFGRRVARFCCMQSAAPVAPMYSKDIE
jgi:hypothetical protein